jgi:hypothetical protein
MGARMGGVCLGIGRDHSCMVVAEESMSETGEGWGMSARTQSSYLAVLFSKSEDIGKDAESG